MERVEKVLRRAADVLNPLPARAVAKQKKNCALVVHCDARDAALRLRLRTVALPSLIDSSTHAMSADEQWLI